MQLTHQWGGGDYPVRYKDGSEGRMTTMRTFSSVPAIWNPQKFDVSGCRGYSSAAILIYPNGGSGQTPDYQPASTGLYFRKREAPWRKSGPKKRSDL